MSQKTIGSFTTTYNCFEMHYPFMECIRSLLGFCDEVSIVDAGSTDGTVEALEKLARENSRVKFSVEPVDFTHPRWAIYQDGYLKAKARDKCTTDYLWQTDTDEIVAPHDYQKIRQLPDIVGSTPLIMLPMIEFWGDMKTIRADFFSWKPRFSINDKRITHGIPKDLRCYDSSGHEYPRPFDSDSCNYIYRDTLESVPIVIPVENSSLKNVALGTKEYEELFYQWIDTYPVVFHASWLDLRRKVLHYKKLWRRFHGSMYNLNIEDNATNNVMFEKPWSEVSDYDIKLKAEELKNLGPRFFHKKMDREKKGHVILFNRPVPEELTAWYEKEINSYEEVLPVDPLVSAVIPVLQNSNYLADSVESIVRQDYPKIEILVVNDGDKDATSTLIEGLRNRYPEKDITLINKKAGCLADAKNFGVRQAKGTYVLLLESEDLLRPDYVSKAVHALKSNEANVVFSNVELDGEKKGEKIPERFDPYFLRYSNSISKGAIFSRSLWSEAGGFKPSLPFSEDWDFWLNCSKVGIKPVHLNEKLVIDRIFSGYDAEFSGGNAEKIMEAVIKIANQDMYSVEEVISAQELLVKTASEWLWRCESLERSFPEDWFLKFLKALGNEGRGSTQDSMNYLGASIHCSAFKNWQPIYRLASILEKNNKRAESLELYHSVRSLRPDMSRLVNPKLV